MVPIESKESNDADLRDTSLAEREARLAARLETVVNVLDAAKQRDIEAEARDRVSSERDHAADLEAFLTPVANNGYCADLPARRHAPQDRHDAKGDRTSAADDRAVLSDVAEGR